MIGNLFRFVVALIVFFGSLSSVLSLDASWIPSDPDGPLPLSSAYRESLRKLCDLLDKGQPLPTEIEKKKKVIAKLCKRLEADKIIGDSDKPITITAVATVLGFGGATFLWWNRRSIGHFISGIFNRGRGIPLPSPEQIRLAREARMRHFAEMKDGCEQ